MRLTKHHALGNDFLVLFDDQRVPRMAWGGLALKLCDRRRGIGADGLLVGLTARRDDGAQLGMALFNADGSRAEMSGNGIRCLAQAWAMRGGGSEPTVVIATDAGPRAVTLEGDGEGEGVGGGNTLVASVAMGQVTAIDPPPGWAETGIDPLRPATHLSLGNPHAVVAVDDADAVDLLMLGQQLPGVNLEVVAATAERHAVRMRVHERGAGITLACGTGACAAAWAANEWGLATPDAHREITVRMDGGDARVRFDDELVLVGPTTFIASIETSP